MQFIVFLLITINIIGLDLWSKSYVSKILANNNIVIWQDIMLTLHYNYGIAFSLPIKGVLQIILSLGLLFGLLIYAHKTWYWKNWLITIAIASITGGAVGNLIERISGKGVTDFIQIFSWFPVFNLADSFIFIGVLLLFYYEITNKHV